MLTRLYCVMIGAVFCTAAAAGEAHAQSKPVVFTGATIYPVSSEPIESGVLVFQDGKFTYAGGGEEVRLSRDTERHDATGKVIIPGLVDTHSHRGLYGKPSVSANADGNESTAPATPDVRALDAIWPADPGIRMALAGGVTTANIMPGSGNVVGGQTAYVKYRGDTIEEMLIKDEAGAYVLGGMKMANGENPKRTHAHKAGPMTRMGVAAHQRKLFVEAQEYKRKWDKYHEKIADGEEADPPGRDLRLEPMVEVLERKRVVHHHTHRADDIMTVLRLSEEFGFRVVLQHVSEGFLVADEIAKAGAPASCIILDSPGGKHEATRLVFENARILDKAGVKVAFHTDDGITDSRLFLRSGALGIRAGLPEETALRALTLTGAEMLDLQHRIGSLEAGKDADFVVLSGPPFSVRTRVLETWIDGERVWSADDEHDLLYQTGGFQIAHRYPAIEEAQ